MNHRCEIENIKCNVERRTTFPPLVNANKGLEVAILTCKQRTRPLKVRARRGGARNGK